MECVTKASERIATIIDEVPYYFPLIFSITAFSLPFPFPSCSTYFILIVRFGIHILGCKESESRLLTLCITSISHTP